VQTVTNNVAVAASSEGRCGGCFRSRKLITLCIYVVTVLPTYNCFSQRFGKLRSSMVLEWIIVGSIPRRIPGRFRASQATRPPRQGLLFRSYSKSSPCTTVESRYLGARVGERALDSSVRNKTVPSVATHPPQSGVDLHHSAIRISSTVICHL
jgi:hypothetical protein